MRKILPIVLLLATCQFAAAQWLWQIGKEDGQYKEFALAVQGIHQYQSDPLFVVGRSDAAKDWPFIQPGPSDPWAGKTSHTFSIVFGLAKQPSAGDCILHVALVDTHPEGPPMLNIFINGKEFDEQMPRGGGDSFDGHPENGKPYKFDVHFPSDLLKSGPNLIEIVNAKGSWMLYDALALSAPTAQLQKLNSFTIGSARAVRALVESGGKLWQPIEVNLRRSGPSVTATIAAQGQSVQREVDDGLTDAELLVPPVKSEKNAMVSITAAEQIFTASVALKPVRQMTVYVLPHSHHDLGYTDMQDHVEIKQMGNLRKAIAIAKKTANYPPGARFVWNTEVLWSTDQFLQQASRADREAFIAAVKNGQIALSGMYANGLTGLCRPEELLQLFRYSTQLSQQFGVTIDSANQSDVPGMTWGTSTAMAQAGIHYFSLAPNWFDRIGSIMATWQDKPFWWVSPSGHDKVLVWIPWTGYALSHVIGELSPGWIAEYQQRLDDIHYPYDITYVRWSGHGDNAEPDPAICEFIKDWNNEYAWPKFCIASTHDIFSALEKRYGDKLPKYKGDLTPYWEDGAASSALETAINRTSGDRLVQAEAMYAIRGEKFPTAAFSDAWRNILLYSEHTWGAWCSVSNSEWAFTTAQWAVKQAFALDGGKEAKKLLVQSSGIIGDASATQSVDVYNTTSWPRTELAIVPKNLSPDRDRVSDSAGHPIPSQRLTNGDLAVLVSNIPPFASMRLNLSHSLPFAGQKNPSTMHANSLDNGVIHATAEEKTGGINMLSAEGIKGDFAKSPDGEPLNDYLYLPGDNLANVQHSDPGTITIIDNGPLVASFSIDSTAAGCNKLTREIRLTAGADYLQVIDTLDKKRVALNPHLGQGKPSGEFAQRGSKESVSFAFPFNVPDGQIHLDIPLGSMRPEVDQLPGACKNWLPVGRYADVSNKNEGITLATLDAPLVELGRLSTLLGSQRDPAVWRQHIEPTQTIYSWVMNNHWGTNYRAYQEGVVTFRYALRPHGKYDPAEAARFSTGLSQPLIVVPAANTEPRTQSLLRVEPADVLVETLKPSDDGHAWIVRLFGASGKDRDVKLIWSLPAPIKISVSNLSETAGEPTHSKIKVPGWELVTLRAEYP
jgi:alpha-mannosidase